MAKKSKLAKSLNHIIEFLERVRDLDDVVIDEQLIYDLEDNVGVEISSAAVNLFDVIVDVIEEEEIDD